MLVVMLPCLVTV